MLTLCRRSVACLLAGRCRWCTAHFATFLSLQLLHGRQEIGIGENLVRYSTLQYNKRAALLPVLPQGRQEIGIGENLVRYSCGVEDVEDLWADLEQALARI